MEKVREDFRGPRRGGEGQGGGGEGHGGVERAREG